VTRYGKVTGLVYYDPKLGQHLLVQPYQRTSGLTTHVPTGAPEEVAYAVPPLTAFGYAPGDWVQLVKQTGGLQYAVRYATT
jgi:hypothetical protein